jgi:flavin-dependent dehydrogenase
MERFDVIVVGLGPAGAAASTALAAGGARVLAVDRAAFPRDKACGDALTPKAFPALARLDVLDALLAAGRSAPGYVWRSPGGREQTLALPPPPGADDPRRWLPLTVPRRTLDALLRGRAESAGAVVRERQRVTDVLRGADGLVVGVVGSSGGTAAGAGGRRWQARADLVLAADGALSPTVRAATGAAPPRIAWGVRLRLADLARPPAHLAFRFDARLLPGYAWLFPLPEGGLNAGLGVPAGRLRGVAGGPRALFEATLGAELRRAFPEARIEAPLAGAPVPVSPPPRPLPPGLLALGDAAGLVDPFSGEGVPAALLSGLAAADAALRHGPGRFAALAADYGAVLARGAGEARLARLCARLAASPWRLERAMDLARRRPALAVHGVATLARRGYRDLFGRALLRALLER